MPLANWCVVPSLKPWRGDLRRNPEPYYIGRNMSLTEYAFAQYVKARLTKLGIDCHCELLEVK